MSAHQNHTDNGREFLIFIKRDARSGLVRKLWGVQSKSFQQFARLQNVRFADFESKLSIH